MPTKSFAVLLMAFAVAPAAKAIDADQNSTVLLNNTSPAFIEDGRLWAVHSPTGSGPYQLVYSDNEGDNWTTHATLSEMSRPPSSLFVHPVNGDIYIAEAQGNDCRNARIFRVPDAGGMPVRVRYLDPGATVLPWGWSLDGQNNLFAAEYGWSSQGAVDCGQTRNFNTSYVFRIADGSGVAVPENDTNVSRWSWQQNCFPPEENGCFARYVAPTGSFADRHVHVLRYVAEKSLFLVTAGDSPRTFWTWSGDLETLPASVPRCCDTGWILTGFTGIAPAAGGVYTADDFTAAGASNRGNSVRRYTWNASNTLVSPTLVKTLPVDCDTPIYDLHANTTGNELWLVNYDEPLGQGDDFARKSGVHRLSGTNFGVFETFYAAGSASLNLVFLATNAQKQVPAGNHVFAWGKSSENAPPVGTALIRISRAAAPTDAQTACL